MNPLPAEELEKQRQLFDSSPYPRKPLDDSPKDPNALFIHNLVTPYYLKYQQVVDTKEKLILDAGCGSGWQALLLAKANPGARVVGIDLSPESVKLAQQRLHHHGFDNSEFHVIAIADLPKFGLEFDFINCDETLYLLPERDPSVGLTALKSVLKPQGILRANLHSALQRSPYFRCQDLFKLMGLLDSTPGEMEVDIVIETMKALQDRVDLKMKAWNSKYETSDSPEQILMNHLLQGDKGYTIPELFAALRAADLDFLSMVEWRRWELMELFKNPEELPTLWAMSLPDLSDEERLQIFELIHPIHRLLDFWCTHPGQGLPTPVLTWDATQWETATVHLHPQLATESAYQDLEQSIRDHKPFEISRYVTQPTTTPVLIDSTIAACLLPLWKGSQPFMALVERWKQIHPLNSLTLEPIEQERATEDVKQALIKLESFLYILLERTER